MSDQQLDLQIPELKFLFLAIRHQKEEYAEEMQALLNSSPVAIGSRLATLLKKLLNIDIQIPKEGETVIVCGSIRVITENIRAESRSEGRAEGKLETVLSLFHKGKLKVSDAAEEAGMSVEQFLAKAKMS